MVAFHSYIMQWKMKMYHEIILHVERTEAVNL